MKNTEVVELLTDPWYENSAIWENGELTKMSPYKNYLNKPFTDHVEW